MLLTAHILSGMTFGSLTAKTYLSPLFGFLSYFVLESIPHWDIRDSYKKFAKIIRILDFTLAFFSFALILILNQLNMRLILGGITSVVVYLFFYLGELNNSEKGFWGFLKKLKKKIQYHDKSVWGILIQIAICVLAVAIIFNLIDFPTWNRVKTELFNHY
jgi:hypothetical protein